MICSCECVKFKVFVAHSSSPPFCGPVYCVHLIVEYPSQNISLPNIDIFSSPYCLRVSIPGEYRVGLKFNDQHIPDSPFRVWISSAIGDAHLLEVAQFPEGLQVDKPAQFYIRFNGAKGELDARVSKLINPNPKTLT